MLEKLKLLKEQDIINDYKIDGNMLYISPKPAADNIDLKIEKHIEDIRKKMILACGIPPEYFEPPSIVTKPADDIRKHVQEVENEL